MGRYHWIKVGLVVIPVSLLIMYFVHCYLSDQTTPLKVYPKQMVAKIEISQSSMHSSIQVINATQLLNINVHINFKNKRKNISRWRIPNIVHFIWKMGSRRNMKFTEMVSILSAYKVQRAKRIIIHCDVEPAGKWWIHLQEKVPIYMYTLAEYTHKLPHRDAIDLAKINVLSKYGGIYMDLDSFIINPLDDLMVHDFVLGHDTRHSKVSTSVIMTNNQSVFMNKLQTQIIGKPSNLFIHDILDTLSTQHSTSLHLESYRLTSPSLANRHLLFSGIDLLGWRPLFILHARFRQGENDIYDPDYIILLKNTIGKVLQYVYYGAFS